jgi:UDP-N-acetylglucosamine diphosphorylase / glucose-1-phosphate thymidylyltransferase / UDP-N-acetylgalactosamine diphosphorylase / glucosamine-1-phosphate N-acetyltransferase / galactosamine-1-phosphate N-acetyltransferase
MDAVILAAGLGTRLRPHTLHTPKPLLPVRGRPILDWTFGALPPQVDRVVVVVHYLAEQVEEFLRRQTWIPHWEVVHQTTPRGTGDALLSCHDKLRPQPFLVLNGDDLYGAGDLAKLAACRAGLLAKPVDEPRRFGIAFLHPDGTLRQLLEKPDIDGPQLANAGAYVFPPEAFDIQLTLSSRNEYEITQYVDGMAQRGRVDVVPAEFWLPIGTEETWKAAEKVDLETVMKGR